MLLPKEETRKTLAPKNASKVSATMPNVSTKATPNCAQRNAAMNVPCAGSI